jgi:hypothetical protein
MSRHALGARRSLALREHLSGEPGRLLHKHQADAVALNPVQRWLPSQGSRSSADGTLPSGLAFKRLNQMMGASGGRGR